MRGALRVAIIVSRYLFNVQRPPARETPPRRGRVVRVALWAIIATSRPSRALADYVQAVAEASLARVRCNAVITGESGGNPGARPDPGADHRQRKLVGQHAIRCDVNAGSGRRSAGSGLFHCRSVPRTLAVSISALISAGLGLRCGWTAVSGR